MRSCGILLPIFSLPSRYGIGGFSKEAYRFIDRLKEAKQSYWQILPLGPTGYGDSPYQSFSSFAGNPYFIDLDTLSSEGLLEPAECQHEIHDGIDYEWLHQTRFFVLRKAFLRFDRNQKAFRQFCEEQNVWLDGYSQFMALKEHFGGIVLSDWPEEFRLRKEPALSQLLETLSEEIDFWKFLQFEFYTQWGQIKSYANKNGIQIIGDIPIYVAYDSADVWTHPELFSLDASLIPKAVAGCPPDAFSETGQLWGNPLYEWDYHKKTDYAWWMLRLCHALNFYDVVRIDHFRGFDEYYSIPYGSKTAEHGTWKKGPGIELFRRLDIFCPRANIIAEDLGFLTDSVIALREATGFPGMKILQFAFDAREESDYLPHNYEKNCVVYTGTHDNDTMLGWLREASAHDVAFALQYIGTEASSPHLCRAFIRLAMQSVADLAIIPMQDYLEEDSSARINTPSTLGGNWVYQMKQDSFSTRLVTEIAHMTKLYGRIGKEQDECSLNTSKQTTKKH